jgi:glyoxylase-like metal-dependent hydrolase (beta-lactamase superfamily II)
LEIIPGIHQIEVPLPNSIAGPTNVYLAQGTHGWLLVDTGWDCAEAREALESQLREIGLGFADIEQIVITHVHIDHYTLIGRVKELSGAKTAFHQKDYEILQAMSLSKGDYAARLLRQFQANGFPEDELTQISNIYSIGKRLTYPLDPPDVALQDGDVISTGLFDFEIIWTPGHTPGNTCLYEPIKKILLTGDHILPITTPNINMQAPSDDNPLKDYLESLRKVSRLNVDLVLPGHEHIFAHLQERILFLLSHHDQRLDHVFRASRGDGKTAYQIAHEVPWVIEPEGFREVAFEDLAIMDKAMAVGETLAHLEYLRFEGRVEKDSRNELIFYRA